MGSERRAAAALLAAALALAGCGARSGGGTAPVRRLSIATGGTGGVYYPLGGALARLVSAHLPGVSATAEATAASVDNLKFLQRGEADLAFTLADTLDDALAGRAAFAAGGPVAAQALAVLYDNATQVVVRRAAGLARLGDLRGRTVSTGAPGSGTEVIALRLLAAAGLDPARDLRRESLGVAAAADAFKDGKLDAFFWSGGLPTAAILDLAHATPGGIALLASDEWQATLGARFGPSLYRVTAVPRATYPGLDADVPVLAVANVLVVRADLEEPLAHDLTALLFEHQAALQATHAEARHIRLERATRGSPAPFHPGAARFYRERGVRLE